MILRLFFVLALLGAWGNILVTSRAQTPNANGPPPSKAETNDERFHSKLLKITHEYQKYRRVDFDAHLAALDCRAPSRFVGVPRLSQSTDTSTHGKKVYYLYAKNQQAYREVSKSADQRGQVVVKETWQAKLADARGKIGHDGQGPQLTATDGDQHFVPGEAGALFIMYRNDDAKLSEATDEGWVYGTSSVDRKTITSAGRVESCQQCHQSAPHGRLFGLKDLPPILTKSKKPTNKPAG